MITDYSISFQYHLNNLVQWFDAGAKRMAWMRVLIATIEYVHALFISDRDRVNREATYNCQTMVMERALNLRYYNGDYWHSLAAPTALGHIYIENVSNAIATTFSYYDVEQQTNPTVYYNAEAQTPAFYTYYESEYQSQYDFIVWVPASLTFNQDEMRAFIDLLVFGGMRYTILTY